MIIIRRMALKRRRGYSRRGRSFKRRRTGRRTFRRAGYRKRFSRRPRYAINRFPKRYYKSNSLQNGGMSGRAILQSMKNGGTVFRHSEYICDVLSPGPTIGFTPMEPFIINPGNLVTFPWGSNIANCFEEYRMRGCVLEYRTLCTENATGEKPSMGAIIMGTKYNTLESNFDSKMEMENYEYTTSAKPSKSMMHPINCKGITNKLFINSGAKAYTNQADRRLYDLAAFTIASNNVQAAKGQALGELWVHYEVVLYKPKLITDNASLWDEWGSTAMNGNATNYFNATKQNNKGTMSGSVNTTLIVAGNVEDWAINGQTKTTPGAETFSALDGLPGCCYLFPPNVTEGQFTVTITWNGTAAGTQATDTTADGPILGLGVLLGGARAPRLIGPYIAIASAPNGQITTWANAGLPAALSSQCTTTFSIDLNGPGSFFWIRGKAAGTAIGQAGRWMTNTAFQMVINEIGGTFTDIVDSLGSQKKPVLPPIT